MKVEDIKKILIVGAGTMGQQIGFLFAVRGFDVVLYDVNESIFKVAMKRMGDFARRYVRDGKLQPAEVEGVIARISTTADMEEAARDADLVSESVLEDPKLKGGVFAKLDKICPKETIFTTNTSTLLPSMFADATGRPDRFLALHFHNTILNSVVDVMPHPGTSSETVEFICEFAEKRLKQIVIRVNKENQGFVFNAMFSSWLTSAQTLVANEVASIEDVDRAWMGVMDTMIGPFGIIDNVGLDTAWKIVDFWAKDTKDPQAIKNAAFMKDYVDKGYLGVKTKRGFYTYPHPTYTLPGFLTGRKKND